MRLANLKCKFKCFATQSKRSRDPNLGRDPQFADIGGGTGGPHGPRSPHF